VEQPTIHRTESQISGARENPELLREIFNEPERENVFEDLLEWACGLKG
jgi:hypothetical protein